MGDEHVEFFEAAFVEQQVDAFAGGEFPFRMLRIDALLTAAELGFLAERDKLFDFFLIDAHKKVCVVRFLFVINSFVYSYG